jgi:O-antigen ligase
MVFLLYLLVFVLPLGTRLLLGSAITGFHEYESLFLYASDIVVCAIAIWGLISRYGVFRRIVLRPPGSIAAVFILTALVQALVAPSMFLGMYAFVRLVILFLMSAYAAMLLTNKRVFQAALIVLAVAAVLQAGIGIAQVSLQRNIGLQNFGEPILVSYTGAASTIVVGGGRLLRAYGTFPHPNVAGAFLALGLLALAYLYLESERRLQGIAFPTSWRSAGSLKKAFTSHRWRLRIVVAAGKKYFGSRFFAYRMLIVVATFIVVLSLALTFSRSAWLSAAFGLGILILWGLHQSAGAALRLGLLLVVVVFFTYQVLSPAVAPRAAVSNNERAVVDRLEYAALGISMLADHPFGVGTGNQVLYGVTNQLYQQRGLTHVWQWEPIHNLYLLIAVELGWVGMLSFLAFLAIVLWRLVRSGPHLETGVAAAMLAAMLCAGLFDHYLWDLQQGRLMLWLVIGFALSRIMTLPQRKA